MKAVVRCSAKIVHLFVILVILLGLLHLVQTILPEIVHEFTRASLRQSSNTSASDPAQRTINFLADGTVCLVRQSQERDPNTDKPLIEIYDANNILTAKTVYFALPVLTYAYPLGFQYDRQNMSFRFSTKLQFSSTLDVPVIHDQSVAEIWRYNLDQQQFTGYDASGRKLGHFGKLGLQDKPVKDNALGIFQGFQAGMPKSRQSPVVFWLTQRQLYEIDFSTRQIKCWVDSPSPIISLSLLNMPSFEDRWTRNIADPNAYRPLIACGTESRMQTLILYNTKKVIRVTEPQEWQQWTSNHTRYTATTDQLFVHRQWINYPESNETLYQDTADYQQWLDTYQNTCKEHCAALYRIDMQGQLTLVSKTSWTESIPQSNIHVIFSIQGWSLPRALSAVSPGLYCITPLLRTYWLELNAKGHQQGGFLLLSVMPHALPDLLIASSLCVLLTWLHIRSREPSKLRILSWLMFVLCFNLAGLLTYLALNHTPLICCSVCQKKRGLIADACARCHAPLAQPEHTRPHLLLS
jgi:hypothetical protein